MININIINLFTDNNTWVFLALVMILCFIACSLRLYFSRRKDRKRILELEQKLLLSQMNPHFVFNSLTAIQNYIFQNEPYLAGRYMASFAKLVRLILENSRMSLIPISKEVETITHYLELQSIRFQGKFDYTLSIDPDIDKEHHSIPPMLAQPFIENAIEHGIIHLSEKGQIKISFLLSDQSIVLEVEDNGLGIDRSLKTSEKKRVEYESLATRITNERLSKLKKSYGQKVSMETIDLSKLPLSSKTGTLVRFTIPLIETG